MNISGVWLLLFACIVVANPASGEESDELLQQVLDAGVQSQQEYRQHLVEGISLRYRYSLVREGDTRNNKGSENVIVLQHPSRVVETSYAKDQGGQSAFKEERVEGVNDTYGFILKRGWSAFKNLIQML